MFYRRLAGVHRAFRIEGQRLLPDDHDDHLLVQTPDANLSRCMRHINGVHTQRFNSGHSVDGQLFHGRYKAIVVAENSYLLQLVRYIHRNPVRAGIVEKTDDYKLKFLNQSGWRWTSNKSK
jgi:putative transposase